MKSRDPLAVSKRSASVIHAMFLFYAIACIVPILLVFAISFSDETTVIANGYKLIPEKFSLTAYEFLFRDIGSDPPFVWYILYRYRCRYHYKCGSDCIVCVSALAERSALSWLVRLFHLLHDVVQWGSGTLVLGLRQRIGSKKLHTGTHYAATAIPILRTGHAYILRELHTGIHSGIGSN